jgi:membrane fusion protein (multidrug efflux system)
MEIVPLKDTYVVANFKETQLTRVRPGQPAHISIDAFPGEDLPARVASIAPASGLEFSLLPPDNATGNFTKIVQRVPVKLAIDRAGKLSGRLRPGMSVDVSIDTRLLAGAAASAAQGE